MKKVELLAPAGSMESLIAAVNAGCDAVYLGGKSFGARAFAGNFDENELKEAIKFCHLRNVKVYVTVNTLVYQSEIEACLAYVDQLVEAHVDALLIQDFGLFNLLKNHYPQLELHASTQMHAHNLNCVRFLKEQGIKRIVLARETPLDIIEECCKENIEIEVFVHGALCVSYSGQCLMSSILKNRSGNRGECAQMCRMKYKLLNTTTHENVDGDPYLLSLKDLNSLENVKKLIDAGVSSLKIEGRMKRPEYVSLVVSCYRRAIDEAMKGKEYRISDAELKELKKIFNRGFTQGYLFDETKDLANSFRPNHIGIEIGKVVAASSKRVKIQLSDSLNQKDGIRILHEREDVGFIVNKMYKNGKLIASAKANDIIELDCTDYIKPHSVVLKTSDHLQLESLQKKINEKRANPIDIEFEAEIGKPLKVIIKDTSIGVSATGKEICMKATKMPISKDKMIEQLSKINNTPFTLNQIRGKMDEMLFISIKEINECRRRAIDLFIAEKLKRERLEKQNINMTLIDQHDLQADLFLIQNEAQLNQIKKLQDPKIIVSERASVYLRDPDSCRLSTYRAHERAIKVSSDPVYINNIGDCYNHQNMIVGSGLNITNAYAAAYFINLGAQAIVLSDEISDEEANRLKKQLLDWGYRGKVGRLVYGRRDLMITKFCLINTILKDGSKKGCSLCKENSFALADLQQNQYPIYGDDLCVSHILESRPMIREGENDEFKVYRFTVESDQEIKAILNRRKKNEN